MARRAVIVALALIWISVTAGTALAQNRCAGAKIRAAGKKAKGILGVEAKAARRGTTAAADKVRKCKDKLPATFAKAEGKGGCLTTGDAATIEGKVDAFVADVGGELATGSASSCQSTKLKAAGKKAACLLGLTAKEAAKGIAAPSDKVARCGTRLSGAFSKTEARGGCATTGDAGAIAGKVDAFVADVDGELGSTALLCGDPDDTECDGVCPAGRACVPTPDELECHCVVTNESCGALVVLDEFGDPIEECFGLCPGGQAYCVGIYPDACLCSASP